MGRPRHGKELKTPVTIRLDPAIIGLIDTEAKRRGTHRSVIVSHVLTEAFSPTDRHWYEDHTHVGVVDSVDPDGTAHTTEVITNPGQPPVTNHETRRVTQDQTVTQDETTIGQRIQDGAITYTQATCGHPRNNRTNLGWGTRCNVCHAILKP